MKLYKSRKAEAGILETYDRLLEKWNVAYAQRDVGGPYGQTHVIECGDAGAPPLVLFHGVGDDSALMWIYNMKAFAARFHVFAVDTLGGPGKSRPNEAYGQGFDTALWIDSVLDALGIQACDLAGVSNGAYIAEVYALERPERVRRAVCMAGTVPVGKGGSMKTMMKVFMPEALFPTRKNVEKLIRKLCGDRPEVFLRDETIMEHYRWLMKGFQRMAMRYHTVRHFTPEEVDKIRDKTLYIVGGRDPFQLLGGRGLLEAYHMRARFIEGAGHGINHEYADDVNQMVIEELTR